MHEITSTTRLSFYPCSALPTKMVKVAPGNLFTLPPSMVVVGKGRRQEAEVLYKQLRSLALNTNRNPSPVAKLIPYTFLRTCSRSIAPLPVVLGRYSKSSFTSCKLRFLRSVRTQLITAHNDLEQVLRTYP